MGISQRDKGKRERGCVYLRSIACTNGALKSTSGVSISFRSINLASAFQAVLCRLKFGECVHAIIRMYLLLIEPSFFEPEDAIPSGARLGPRVPSCNVVANDAVDAIINCSHVTEELVPAQHNTKHRHVEH